MRQRMKRMILMVIILEITTTIAITTMKKRKNRYSTERSQVIRDFFIDCFKSRINCLSSLFFCCKSFLESIKQ